ncbi:unnamed protein product [Rotaria sp. Silwood2]|nr:unnamed protein product [Rotaria sp. Silwood2]CAF2919508.1 unnamed protein product [Rotaria sp. Silwood2]CAF4349806.1 unnamed protein product [Rotaria sp. Silwood2]CAF4456961.1 unnamed protein product [Rotaria sp. Silwood2]
MSRNKISDDIKKIVKYLLTKMCSYSMIKQELFKMNLNVSKSTINRIANKVEKQRLLSLLNNQNPKFYRRRQIAISDIARHIT